MNCYGRTESERVVSLQSGHLTKRWPDGRITEIEYNRVYTGIRPDGIDRNIG